MSSDSESETEAACQLPQPIWASSGFSSKQPMVTSNGTISLRPALPDLSVPKTSTNITTQNSDTLSGSELYSNAVSCTSADTMAVGSNSAVAQKESEKRAAALQIVLEAKRQTQWSSKAAEERAAREREENERRQREADQVREAERKKEREARRLEDEKRKNIELRKREDKIKRGLMPSAPERLNAHELLTEFESTIDISSIDASFVMRQFT